MYNTFLNLPFVIEVQQGEIIYNGFVLHKTDTCHLSFFWGKDWPRVQLNNFNLPNSLWEGNNSSFTRSNSFTIRGRLKGSNAENLRELQDTLKGFVNEQGKKMQVNFWWEVRKGEVYMESVRFETAHYTIDSVLFEIQFTLLKGYWESFSITSITHTAIDGSFTEEIITNSTFLETYPMWNITFTWGTNEFTLNVWGNEININESIVSSDILIIDTKEQTVELNGMPIDFSGTFPILKKGNNSFTITTTAQYSISVNFNNTYF